MTVLVEPPDVSVPPPEPHRRATGILGWATTTDHKVIGISYMVTAMAFFLVGAAMAGLMRAQLARPEQDIVGEDTYNQMFTMHGTIMVLLFVSPFAFGIANYFVPIMLGARDMAFPRLNALGYWFTLFAGITMLGGFATADGAAKFGWYGYTPLSDGVYAPNIGGDLWIVGIALLGFAGIITAVNVVATVSTMRAPGMTMFRMPVLVWTFFAQSLLVLVTFPVLTAAGVMLFVDRNFDGQIFNVAGGGDPLLWQHLFWWFGHPEVYIVVLPYFGVFTEIFAVFSRRPVFAYKGFVFAALAIALLSFGVWAHHMFTTGQILAPFFSGLTMLIAVPTGIKFFNWIGTMWGGRLNFEMPLVWAIGFLVTFLLGGLTGPVLASAPLDYHLSDSYFVVAHFHYVMVGGSAFGVFAAIYYWWPKITGRMLSRTLGWWHFGLFFVGFHLTFMVQHFLGVDGMPRRFASYREADGWGTMNLISTAGAFLQGIALLPLVYNLWWSRRRGPIAGDDPWDGHTLEWWTHSPPPPENFDRPLPPIRSERPVWDYNHPDQRSTH